MYEKVIVITERGYENYNAFAHIEQKGWKYVIRVKDIDSNGILSSLDLPAASEFDANIHLILTKKQTILKNDAGLHFDPDLIDIFLKIEKAIFEISNKNMIRILIRKRLFS